MDSSSERTYFYQQNIYNRLNHRKIKFLKVGTMYYRFSKELNQFQDMRNMENNWEFKINI